MLSFIFGKAVILLVIFNICGPSLISADDSKDSFEFTPKFAKRSFDLTPRLGKRSLHMMTENDRQALYRMLEAADTLKYYYDQMQYYGAQADDEPKVSKKVIFTPKLGRSVEEEKSYEVDFTPRLGRRRLNDEAVTPSDSQLYRNDPEQIESRSQYFSPRLGRGGSMTFSPRLGRSLVYDLYPEGNVRIARSVNKTKST